MVFQSRWQVKPCGQSGNLIKKSVAVETKRLKKFFKKNENFFKAGKKCVLYCKASLIAASDAKTTRVLA
jgi:hypothetical protein